MQSRGPHKLHESILESTVGAKVYCAHFQHTTEQIISQNGSANIQRPQYAGSLQQEIKILMKR